ncbi:MAG: MltA domain-containing protein [Campylobacterales bacterium]|nr:MltA domain-containing protein [Campylobacterales bacterium]
MKSWLGYVGAVALLASFWGCAPKQTPLALSSLPVMGEVVAWESLTLEGVQEAVFFEAFHRSCALNPLSAPYCGIQDLETFKGLFSPVKLSSKGLMSGYYEPTLRGSKTRSEVFSTPLYARPKEMLSIELSSLYNELSSMRLRGRLNGTRVVPYASHEEIDQKGVEAEVLCYVDSKVDAFFLQIQGSGKVVLEDGEVMYLGYADQNGHPYRAIGGLMRQQGFIDAVSMQSIRDFLEANPDRADAIMHANPSYVFFTQKETGATGALGVELTPYGSVAVDRRYIPLGLPLVIESALGYLQPLVVAQDVGGAIRGEARVDYFFGAGEEAPVLAGGLKEEIILYLVLPNSALEAIQIQP